MLFRRRRRTSGTGLVLGLGVAAGLAGISLLMKPEGLTRMKDQENIFLKMAGGMVSIFPEVLQTLIARLLGLGLVGGGSLMIYAGWMAIVSGDGYGGGNSISDADKARVNEAAIQVELMDDKVLAKFEAYRADVVAAANSAASDGLKAEPYKHRDIAIRTSSGEIVARVDLYVDFFKKDEPAEKTGKALMHVAAIAVLADEKDSGAPNVGVPQSPAPQAAPAEKSAPGAVPAMATAESISPATPTPPPGPTEDPNVAAVDRLMSKAHKQWELGKKDVSIMLAEEALQDAVKNLPAGHPKIDEVRKQVEAAKAAAKAP